MNNKTLKRLAKLKRISLKLIRESEGDKVIADDMRKVVELATTNITRLIKEQFGGETETVPPYMSGRYEVYCYLNGVEYMRYSEIQADDPHEALKKVRTIQYSNILKIEDLPCRHQAFEHYDNTYYKVRQPNGAIINV